MKHDFHAHFALALQSATVQGEAIQWLTGHTSAPPPQWSELLQITDPHERLLLVAQAILGSQRERAQSGTRTQSGGYQRWVEQAASKFLCDQYKQMQLLGLEPALPDLTAFPTYSWAVAVPFTLRKPYLSKDDTTFHLLDNPVRKEKIFQVPLVAATGWKGALRAALVQHLIAWWSSLNDAERQQGLQCKRFLQQRMQMARLFGNEKGVETDDTNGKAFLDKIGGERLAQIYRRLVGRSLSSSGFFAGRLHFFPTFFDRLGLEVINPHSRQSGVGERGPILLESVPQGATGTLLLLYVPFGSLDKHKIAQDLEVTAQGVQAMLTTYGFGAKTSSGFGVVEEQLAGQGKLLIRAALSAPDAPTSTQAAPSAPGLARYLETPARLHADFRRPDGSLKSAAEYEALIKSQGRKYGKQDRQLYEKAQKWWEREGRQLAEAAAKEPVEQPAPVAPPQPPVTERMFTTLSGLQEQARQVAEQLRSGGAG
jgi:CRISPR-associated protein Cmr2